MTGTRRTITVDDAPPLSVPISRGVVATGPLLFLSGAGPIGPDGTFVVGEFRAQARLTFDNLRRVVEAAGATMDRVVKVNAWLRDMADFPVFNEVWREVFREPWPARTTVQSDLPGFDIEVDMVVALPDEAHP